MDKRKYMIEDLTRLEIAKQILDNTKPYAYDETGETPKIERSISTALREWIDKLQQMIPIREDD